MVFQIIVKEAFYKEEVRKELMTYFSETVLSRISNVIDKYKVREELIDWPSSTILRMLFTFLGGCLITSFVLAAGSSVVDEVAEIENTIRFVMNGIKK